MYICESFDTVVGVSDVRGNYNETACFVCYGIAAGENKFSSSCGAVDKLPCFVEMFINSVCAQMFSDIDYIIHSFTPYAFTVPVLYHIASVLSI